MTLDHRTRTAAEAVRRYADQEVDPAAMLWRLRAHQRRRSAQVAAVAVAVVAGLVAAAVLVASVPRPAQVVARPLGRVAATIALPGTVFPRVVGVAGGVVWVDGGNATAYRVDPQRNRVAGTLRLPAGSRLAAVGQGSLWLVDERAGTVRQATPGGKIVRTVAIGWASGVQQPAQQGVRLAVDADGGAVWVANQHTGVVRVDRARGKVAGRFAIGQLGSSYYDVIAAGGGVALTHGEPRDAILLDPLTGKATAIHLGGLPTGAAFGAGSFWASVDNATLARIDPASRRLVASIPLDADHVPGDVVVGDGAVWVFAGPGLLQRVDPADNRLVHTLRVGPDSYASAQLAVGAGAVWLSDAEAHTLLRIDPQG
jgi:streptogramin lyase